MADFDFDAEIFGAIENPVEDAKFEMPKQPVSTEALAPKKKGKKAAAEASTQESPIVEEAIVLVHPENALAKEGIVPAKLEALQKEYAGLTINGLDDEEGLEKVREGQKQVKKFRTTTVRICKEGRAPLVEEQKRWIAAEKQYVAAAEELEAALQAQVDEYQRLVEEKDREEREAEARMISERQERMAEWGVVISYDSAKGMGEEEFVAALNSAQAEFEARRAAQEKQEAELRRRDEENAALRRQIAEMQEMMAKLTPKEEPKKMDNGLPNFEPTVPKTNVADTANQGAPAEFTEKVMPVAAVPPGELDASLEADRKTMEVLLSKMKVFKAPGLKTASAISVANELVAAVHNAVAVAENRMKEI